MKNYRKVLSGAMAATMLFAMIPSTNAASSSEIKTHIEELEAQHASIEEQMAALEQQQSENWSSTEEMVAQKNNIEQQKFLLYSEVDNLDKQIAEYRQMIADNQQKLNDAQAHLNELSEKNKDRIRAIEENGKMTYWSVVFKANSFTDLIDRMNMAQEIAESDKKMMESMSNAVKEVNQVQNELLTQKDELDKSHAERLEAQAQLDAKREEADQILTRLNMERSSLDADHEAIEAEKNALVAEYAQAEKEYNEAQAREEAERLEQERLEQEKLEQEQQEQANKPENKPDPDNGTDTTPETEPEPTEPEETTPPSSDSGWLQPCSYIYISSGYGDRGSGWHNGVDFAASYGTPIYATRSGTVTRVRSMTTSYGNHVIVNHGDGYSSLYAHMDYYVVSEGEYVSQGQLIGYVGSTGNSTGPHLHFTIMYNGDDVNPLDYV